MPREEEESIIIKQILKDKLFSNSENAGRLAVKLATNVFFSESEMRRSSLTGRGKLDILDSDKMRAIQDIVVHHYRGKVDNVTGMWEGCKKAISKKCQYIRTKQ